MRDITDEDLEKILLDDNKLNEYIKYIETEEIKDIKEDISIDFTDKVMDKISQNKRNKFRNTMIYYTVAASISLIFMITGLFNSSVNSISSINCFEKSTHKTETIFMSGWTDNIADNAANIIDKVFSK
ncbi:MAG: hypothetical protein ACERKV_09375 [Clostridiaceae bacterium]